MEELFRNQIALIFIILNTRAVPAVKGSPLPDGIPCNLWVIELFLDDFLED